MEKLKFALFSVVTLSLLGLFGYWAVVTLQSGTEYKKTQKLEQLQKENEDLKAEVEKQKSEISDLESKVPAPIVAVNGASAPVSIATVYKYQSLIDGLQKLTDNNVFLKPKSTGPNVGTVQKFLNIYNNTSNKVDNDYGVSTKTAISAFQKDQELTADGQAGPSTFNKMIDWLKQ